MSAALLRIISSIIVVLYIVLWLNYLMKKGSKGYKFEFNRFLELERKANSSRKKEINPECFITPDTKHLPVTDYSDSPKYKSVKKKQEIALKKSTLTMIKFAEPKSNIDLKFEFGIANLDKIIMYEENFQEYIRALNNWAEALVELALYKEAEIILEEAVALGSELSKSYTLLGDIYAEHNDTQKLSALYDKLSEDEGLNSNIQLKSMVLKYLEAILRRAAK